MELDLDFDEYLEKKEERGVAAFIFLLGEEYRYLSETEYWTNHSPGETVYTVRLTEDEFHSLDIGKHPKTFIYNNGKEHKIYDGIPELTAIKQEFRKIRSNLYETKR